MLLLIIVLGAILLVGIYFHTIVECYRNAGCLGAIFCAIAYPILLVLIIQFFINLVFG